MDKRKEDWHFIVMSLYRGNYGQVIEEARFALDRAREMNNLAQVKRLREDIKLLEQMKESRDKYLNGQG